ncbi:nucleotide disphospho-sugar-binding domain-containing protein [Streptomyces sp900105755]|uniref:glycosyltransferase n=1 Tax=Streptomyces sp. 900105755 TaxID=3154389 RepID=UPI00331C0E56
MPSPRPWDPGTSNAAWRHPPTHRSGTGCWTSARPACSATVRCRLSAPSRCGRNPTRLLPAPHARREPRAPAAPGCWSASAPPQAHRPGSGRCCGPSLRWTSTWWRQRGAVPVDTLGLDPERVELVTFLPAAELLDDVSVVVHHGGSGTTFGAAARGVPAVVTPGMPGQARQAARLQAAGAGLALPAGEQGPESVTSAVRRLLTEPAFAAAAHRLRDEIAAMPSPTQVAARLIAATGM